MFIDHHRHLQRHCGDHPLLGILDQPTDSISGIDLTQRALSDRRRRLGRRSSPSPFSSPSPRSSSTTRLCREQPVFLEHNHPGGLLIFRCCVGHGDVRRAGGSCRWVEKWRIPPMALMAITNPMAILLLSRVALKLADD
ncbi:hypothetical protein M8494_24365 [Serratia ureilytica]